MTEPPSITRRTLLAGAGALAAASRLAGQTAPIVIRADRPTVLMGDDAVMTGAMKPWERGPKRLQTRNWNTADDSFTWKVEAPAGGEYLVTALAKSQGAVLELKAGSGRFEVPVATGWDRLSMGSVRLGKGVHEFTLRAVKPVPKMEFYSLELVAPELDRTLRRQAADIRSDTSWMRRAKYGLQFHWTSRSAPRRGQRKPYNEAAAAFPAAAFARTVKDAGAGYAIVTTSHAEHYFPGPIKAIDRIMPGRTTERDLIRDWIDALGEYGIKLMLYYHVGHDSKGVPGGWWERTGYDPDKPQKFLDNWCAITSEVGARYGKGLAGWFFDDACVYYPLNPDFRKLTLAAKTGNPDRLVCYNPWVLPRSTDFQDYLCGEGYGFLKLWENLPNDGTGIYVAGPYKGLQAHTNFILERDWPHDRLNTDIPPPGYHLEDFVADMNAGIHHGVVPSVNLEIYQDGGVGEASLEFMRAVSRALKGSELRGQRAGLVAALAREDCSIAM